MTSAERQELESCPFCGVSANETRTEFPNQTYSFMAWCENDLCPIRPETGFYPTRDEMATAWNTRAALAPKEANE